MRFCLSGFAMAVLAVIGLMFLTSPGYADIYRWVDENGTIWFTDDPTNLPKESHGQFEKMMAFEKIADSSPRKKSPQRSVVKNKATHFTEAYVEDWNRRLDEKNSLVREISTFEKELATARSALQKVPFTGRKGYWFVIDPATGKRVQASYKDSGAIWSRRWPVAAIKARTTESEERKRIQSDIAKSERDLNRTKEKLSILSRGL